MTLIVTLDRVFFFKHYKNLGGKCFYLRFIRGFRYRSIIFLRKDAFYLFKTSRDKIIEHEEGHIRGLKHTWRGVMAWHGLFRL